jgi:hypothetical protein
MPGSPEAQYETTQASPPLPLSGPPKRPLQFDRTAAPSLASVGVWYRTDDQRKADPLIVSQSRGIAWTFPDAPTKGR